ncbi:MAG: Protein of unknown function (DUF3035) [Pelagibacterales bacterium]|nr:Protein of unknown function (DUF3035) [Pelagibacterales bacterium]|tara:strand:+ start:71 stop:379 length:309 start_codon:yes stop_codon:yes gene_type:complete
MIKNKFTTYLLVLFLLSSCGTVKKAGKTLRGDKISSQDEFLVKKKQPLSDPPDYRLLPAPDSLELKNEKNSIQRSLGMEGVKVKSNNKNSSTEKSIISEIRK